MLLNRKTLDRIVAGEVTLAFRRWKRPTVRSGGALRTAVGVLAIERVEPTREDAIAEADAQRAGYPSRQTLLEELAKYRDGQLYRIELRFAGADPRLSLREQDDMAADEIAAVLAKLARLDAGRDGAWTKRVLQIIAQRPTVPAGELAGELGMEKERFKTNVRKLKELGLTESLLPGYRLSPRGRALLTSIE